MNFCHIQAYEADLLPQEVLFGVTAAFHVLMQRFWASSSTLCSTPKRSKVASLISINLLISWRKSYIMQLIIE